MTAKALFAKCFSLVGDAWKILGITLLIFFLGNYLLGLADNVKDQFEDHARSGVIESPAFTDFPDVDGFWMEQKASWEVHFEPYYHFRRGPLQGKYINVDEQGIRRTAKSSIALDAKKVFAMGGSTMWGTGAPDDETIPSYLQSLLGSCYDVYNFGETAYVSAQELNFLLYQLSVGNIPDVVIFYDGINDGYAGAYSPAVPRDPQHLRENRKRERNPSVLNAAVDWFLESNYWDLIEYTENAWDIRATASDGWDKQVQKHISQNSAGVIRAYEAHIRQVKALAKEYGFNVFFFWQPNLFSLTRKMNAYEKEFLGKSSPVLVESQRVVFGDARKAFSNREDEQIYFLGHVFDETEEPIYLDWMHVGPKGNAIVADQMYMYLRDQAPQC